jgi:hypothetical protein
MIPKKCPWGSEVNTKKKKEEEKIKEKKKKEIFVHERKMCSIS